MQHEVAIGDVLHQSASAGGGLEADGCGVVGVHDAVLDDDVADAAGGLAAHVDAGAACAEVGVLDKDVFGGTVDAQSIGVFAGLDGEAIVIGVDVDAIDMHMLGGVDVHAVGAGGGVVAADGDAFDLNILAVEDEEAPYGLVLQGDAGDEHVLGVLDGDQAGTASILAWGGWRGNGRHGILKRDRLGCRNWATGGTVRETAVLWKYEVGVRRWRNGGCIRGSGCGGRF